MVEGGLTKTMLIMMLAFLVVPSVTFTTHSLSANQSIRYNETIVSPQEIFELGFFMPGNSTNHYVGIWCKKVPTRNVVWVANRNSPLTNTTVGELTLTLHGVLILRDLLTGNVLWSSSNSLRVLVRNPIGQLLDTGNFIIYDNGDNSNQNNPIWQSFDFMTDTMLPGMKLGRDLVTGIERHMTSWKSVDDPASGEFSGWLDTSGYPQPVQRHNGNLTYRAGPWNGVKFSGNPYFKPNPIFTFTYVLNQREIYYQFNLLNASVYNRLVLLPSGSLEWLLWIESKQDWVVYFAPKTDQCDEYAVCGPLGICDINLSPICECLEGFEPRSVQQWNVADWSQGCKRTTPLDCGPGEGFKKYSNLKLPDTRGSWFNQVMTVVDCEKMCKSNCSCTAYTYLNKSATGSGTGCLQWFGDLIDMRMFSGNNNGDDLYIRLSASDLDSTENGISSNPGRLVRVIVPIASVALVILVLVCFFYGFKRRNREQEGKPRNAFGHDPENESTDGDLELPLFDLSTILKATDNFSPNSILGEGGFGPVHKGVLEDGQEIAVKRLAKTSTQGVREFKNEVMSISKVQHRNLVKLLGCCIQGDEKMLIYEYMPNKGLDSYIFDDSRRKLLDWPARYNIINGIARGLLYLHQDSRLRIIHRDLKVSNILLDSDMNPKISDFGTAKRFGGNEIEANTNRVVGTYGYMAPEYAGNGIFSIKSDVYSFGVLVLEIVCGERNRGFIHNKHGTLVGHAWELHKVGKSLELLDKCLVESINMSQVLRTIHVSLLCVQRSPEFRPTMTSVILMLGSENALPLPKEPGFFLDKLRKTPNILQAQMEQPNPTMNLAFLHLLVDKLKVVYDLRNIILTY